MTLFKSDENKILGMTLDVPISTMKKRGFFKEILIHLKLVLSPDFYLLRFSERITD